jgi:hypothetical protein
MMGRLGVSDGAVTLLSVFLVVGTWTVLRWALKLSLVQAWAGPRDLLRAVFCVLAFLFIVVSAWLMADRTTAVLIVVGAGTTLRLTARIFWRLLCPRLPHLRSGEGPSFHHGVVADHAMPRLDSDSEALQARASKEC